MITMITETQMRPNFGPKEKRKPWLVYSVWRDLESEGDDRIGFRLWAKAIELHAPWEQRAAIAQEQERVAYEAAKK